jgi:hypothetical protein
MSDNELTPVPTERETIHAEIVDGPHVTNAYTNTPPNVTLAEPTAFIALVLAVLSWIVIPVIGALAALAIAPGAKHKIRESHGQLGGMKLAQAAQVIAIGNLVAATFIIWLLYKIITWIF